MKIDNLNKQLLKQCKDLELKKRGYIDADSMKDIILYLDEIEEDILITPFYISSDMKVLELLYTELSIEFNDKNKLIDFSSDSIFSKEFKELFHPKIIVENNKRDFLKKYVKEYLVNLETFNLKDEFNIEFNGNLFFQLY